MGGGGERERERERERGLEWRERERERERGREREREREREWTEDAGEESEERGVGKEGRLLTQYILYHYCIDDHILSLGS